MSEPTSEQSIFLKAIALNSPAERAGYLDEACRGQPKLRAEMDALLVAHDRLGGRLPPTSADAGTFLGERPGTTVGPYKLLELVGEGGMGSVWMAQQTEPVKRIVALKLIKAGMDSKQVIARFEAERQALALMDHPNIAKVFDGGVVEQTSGLPHGRPYFVMELVKGVSITKYCDEQHLTPRQRLDLFIPICQAVQHAHQKGIIHRDLKPSNVLVALYDGKPVPKVIDFGVAKATGVQLTDATLVTGFGNIIGTLEYMSPEQAQINQLDIDMRSDIYSLGVLLYELLTGSPPFSRKELTQAGMLEMLRVIREQEPSKPSTKLSTAEGLPTLAANRGTEPAKLTRLVRGELDWIVMKALEKDRNRRYETANSFAMDVQRYLADEPVQACPPSVSYRLRKFVRRNKAVLAMSAVLGFAFLLATATLGWAIRDRGAREQQAAHERAARAAVLQGKLSQTLEEVDNASRLGKFAEAGEALKRAENLMAGSEADAHLQARASGWRADLNLVARLQKARLLGVRVDVQRNQFRFASVLPIYEGAFRDYDLDLSTVTAEQAVERIRTRPVEIQRALIAAIDFWAVLLERAKNPKLNQLRAILQGVDSDPWRARLREAATRKDPQVLVELARSAELSKQSTTSLLLLGQLLRLRGKRNEERAVLLRAQEMDPADFWVNSELFSHFIGGPESERAEAVRYQSIAVALQPENAGARLNLGIALSSVGKVDAALHQFRKALEIEPQYGAARFRLVKILADKGNWHEAITFASKGLEAQPNNPSSLNNLAWLLAICTDDKLRNPSRAVQLAERTVALSPQDPLYWLTLGVAYYREAKWQQALEALEKSRRLDGPTKAQGNAWQWLWMSMAHWRMGNKDEARSWYQKSVQMENIWPETLRRFRLEAEALMGITKN